ncbi:5'-nucleotidase [Gracilaria domingensis]|nr:5'-nucleotidase [Gracilaria domingensis]
MRNPDDLLLAEAGVVDLILGGHDHVLLKRLVRSTWVLKSGTDFKVFYRPHPSVAAILNYTLLAVVVALPVVSHIALLLCRPAKIELLHLGPFRVARPQRARRRAHAPLRHLRPAGASALCALCCGQARLARSEVDKVCRSVFVAAGRALCFHTNARNRSGQFCFRCQYVVAVAPSFFVCCVQRLTSNACCSFSPACVVTHVMDADIGLVNSGSFRSDALHPEGSVTLGMIDTILPYKDQVFVAEYSGAELLQRLECSVGQYPHLVGGFCQVSGISFSFDPRRERGSRILRDTVMCTSSKGTMLPIDDEERYRCALKTWIFYGNDGFPGSDESKVIRRSDRPLPELLAKYIAQVKTAGDEDMPQVSPQVEDRIQCVCPDETLLRAYRRL